MRVMALLFCLMLITSMVAAEAPLKILLLSSKDVKAGDKNVVVQVQVKNETPDEIKSAKVRLELSYPFTATRDGSDEFTAGDIATTGGVGVNFVMATFLVDVNNNALYGDYKIPVVVEARNFSYRDSITLHVTGETLLNITDVLLNEGTLEYVQPDQYFTLAVKVRNEGANGIDWLKVTLDTKNELITPTDSDLMRLFTNVWSGKEIIAEYHLYVGKDVIPQNQSMIITLEFKDEVGKVSTQPSTIGLNVVGNVRLDLAKKTTDPVRINTGNPFTLTLKIENTGTIDAKGVKLQIETDFVGDREAYLGKIKKEDYANAIFSLTAPSKGGDIPIRLHIIYEKGGGTEEVIREFTIKVYEPTQSQTGSATYLIGAVVIVVIVAAVVLILRRRKKK
jgi:LPXTG-motif cell wall-anchored protein